MTERTKEQKDAFNEIFDNYITRLVKIEMFDSIKRFGFYKNEYEFFGAIDDEIDEVIDDSSSLQNLYNFNIGKIKKRNIQVDNLNSIINICKENIKELIQVISCCEKYKLSKSDQKSSELSINDMKIINDMKNNDNNYKFENISI